VQDGVILGNLPFKQRIGKLEALMFMGTTAIMHKAATAFLRSSLCVLRCGLIF
jgi:hypothetical protein